MNYITLNNGVKMPQLGYGVYQVSQEECERCVLDALQVGYRSIDTAQSYFNEEQVGTAIEKSRVDRKDIFLTTKVWVEHYGYKEAMYSILPISGIFIILARVLKYVQLFLDSKEKKGENA